MSELQNDIFIDNIMLYWESKWKFENWSLRLVCKSHTSKNVEWLWHVKTEEAKENLKKEKWWVALELFWVHNRKYQDLPIYYTKEVENFIKGKLARQLCDHGHDSILYVGEGYIFKIIILELLCKYSMDNTIGNFFEYFV